MFVDLKIRKNRSEKVYGVKSTLLSKGCAEHGSHLIAVIYPDPKRYQVWGWVWAQPQQLSSELEGDRMSD